MLSPSSASLLRAVASAIIVSGYAVPVRPTRPHQRRSVREAQLCALAARFQQQHGYAPTRSQLALMAGLSRQSVTRILGARRGNAKI